jgi:hypothetical protein
VTTKPRPLPPLTDLNSLYRYDPISGKLFWRITRGFGNNRVVAGSEAGGVSGNGYMLAWVNGKQYYVHRICWKLFHGREAPAQIDHVDNDPTNNAISNLRAATNSENQLHRCNQPSRSNPQPRYRRHRDHGITWCRRKSAWRVMVGNRCVGWFNSFPHATIVRQIAYESRKLRESNARYTLTCRTKRLIKKKESPRWPRIMRSAIHQAIGRPDKFAA